MQLRHLFIGLLLLSLYPLAAGAAVVADLYQANVPVADHSAKQLEDGTREGLAQVLVKVSGSLEVLRDARVVEVLNRAAGFMQQYQYMRLDRDQIELELQFDQQLVTDLLTRLLLPLWTVNRPPVLVWLVVDDATGRDVATRETHPELVSVVEAQFQRRGVPVVFPLYDLQDTLAVSVRDLWQLESLPIYRASQRYRSENVLVGRMRALPEQRWMGDWLYLWQNQSSTLTEYGEPLREFVRSGVHLTAEAMAARYAVAPNATANDGILVRIDGLLRFADYRASLDYLQALELVRGATVEYAAGGSVVFRVDAQLQAQQLQHMISQKGKLWPLQQAEPLDAALPAAALVYQWRP